VSSGEGVERTFQTYRRDALDRAQRKGDVRPRDSITCASSREGRAHREKIEGQEQGAEQ